MIFIIVLIGNTSQSSPLLESVYLALNINARSVGLTRSKALSNSTCKAYPTGPGERAII